MHPKVLIPLAASLLGCGDGDPSPGTKVYASCRVSGAPMVSCGANLGPWADLFPYAADAVERAALDAKARRIDRIFHTVSAATTGLSTEVTVSSMAGKDALAAFAAADGWDFEQTTGVTVDSIVAGWSKTAGAYAGVGVAADAFRYGTLRDQGGDCAEVDRARELLRADLDALHLATAITGVPGVLARGFARRDVAGIGQSVQTTPLFDMNGAALPAEKNNGTWREDSSEGGMYPNYVWEDSCSRDQYVGWVIGMAAAWEVIADDPGFPTEAKARLQRDAAELARSLMIVRDRGYDLEIWDADGRPTYHGILHENGVDRDYIPNPVNGHNALLAVGIIAALAYVAEETEIFTYLEDELITARGLPELARDSMLLLDLGAGSNYSAYNMAFAGGWLAQRYLCNADARAVISEAISGSVYDDGKQRQPAEQQQTLYDYVHAIAAGGGTAYGPMTAAPDETAVASGLVSLQAFADAPYFDSEVINCDDAEIAAGSCQALDGSTITLLGPVGWNDELVAAEPVPMAIRPPSNYHWRSNPYRVNGGGNGDELLSGVDFRFTYWMGRWVRR